MRKLFIFLAVMVVFASCEKKDEEIERWKELFRKGSYQELLEETSYSDSEESEAFKILALIGLKKFEDIKPEGSDPFFELVENLKEYRCDSFAGERRRDLSIPEGKSSYENAFEILKEYVEKLKKLDLKEQMKTLSRSYSEMLIVDEELRKDLSQTELTKLKRKLNRLFDEEISKTPNGDVRREMFQKLMEEIDSRLKIISPGLDRPQS